MRIPILIAFLFLALLSHMHSFPLQEEYVLQRTTRPAIGVTVMVQGTTTGTVTDFDGNYTSPCLTEMLFLCSPTQDMLRRIRW